MVARAPAAAAAPLRRCLAPAFLVPAFLVPAFLVPAFLVPAFLALAGCARAAPPGPIPLSLAPEVARVFHARMTPAEVVRNGVLRRDRHGRMLACLTGANLNCGQADRSRRNHGATVWCRAHPDAPFVPKFATGHTTVFDWRCAGQRAVIAAQVQQVDARGFVRGAWRVLPLPP